MVTNEDVNFKRRFEVISFLNSDMYEEVMYITIYIHKTAGGDGTKDKRTMDYELSEVIVYEQLIEDDMKFVKLFECDFWKNDKDDFLNDTGKL